MLSKFYAIMLATVLAALPLSKALADPPTKDEVIAVVKQAIAFYRANGRERALAELNKKDGRFAQGEDYVDVHDLRGICLAHPTQPQIVGTRRITVADANGKFWIKDIIDAAKRNSSGWSRYMRMNPLTHQVQDKLSYWELYDGLIFKAGLYID